MTERTITRELALAAPVERVWRAITDPAELSRWFGDRTELTLVPGAEGAFSWDEHGRYAMRIDEVSPPHRLVWSWIHEPDVPFDAATATRVEWTLEARHDGGTTLTLVESGFRTELHHQQNSEGWTSELGELSDLLKAA